MNGGYKDLRGDPVRTILKQTDGGKARARLLQELDTFAAFMKHFRVTRGMHNLLFSFSPDKGTESRKAYLEYYPGDDLVDVLAFDIYGYEHDWRKWTASGKDNPLLKHCRTVVELAEEKHKIPAIGEFGLKGMPEAKMKDFFTTHFLAPIKNDPLARKVLHAPSLERI